MSLSAQTKYQNLFRALAEQQQYKLQVDSYPIALTLDIASACQLRCPFCIHGGPSETKPRSVLDWNLFSSLIEELGPYLFHVDLDNWGEPFLNKRLIDVITSLKSQSIRVRLSSNISLPLSNDYLEAFVRCQPDFVIISIDGFSQETYEKYRVTGDFRLAISNLETMARLRSRLRLEKPRLVWQFLVFSFNEHELAAAHAHANRIGVEFRPSAPYVNIDRHPEWLPSQERFVREPYRALHAKMKSGREPRRIHEAGNVAAELTSTGMALGDLERDAVAFTERDTSRRYACDWLYLKACINADGSLSSCCGRFPGDPKWGDVGRGAFHRLWNNQYLQQARRSLTRHADEPEEDIICARCPLPEIQEVGQSLLLDVLLSAPRQYRREADVLLNRFPRNSVLERKALRIGGRLMNAMPYSCRRWTKERLRYQLEGGGLRRWVEKFSHPSQ